VEKVEKMILDRDSDPNVS